MRVRKTILLACSLAFLWLLTIGTSVTAQNEDASGLSISPLVFELDSDPKDSFINQVKIYNPTDNTIPVMMLMEDFTPIGETGEVSLSGLEENSTYSLAAWTQIDPVDFDLGPKEQQIVTFEIDVPENGEPGGHYGSIVAFVSGGDQQQLTGSTIGSKRGALILLRVSGDIEEKLFINKFKTKSFQEYGPVEFDVKFENTGNVHVRPAGFITITNIFEQQVAELEIPQNNVIPGAIRQAGTVWEETKLIGKYTATLVANYGSDKKQTITSTTTFIVFPWKVAALIGGILLIIGFTLVRSRKRILRALRVLTEK